MHVAELWRHPVKSLQGERLDEAVIEHSGLSGDRRWGIVDGESEMVLTARRVPSLLLASARLTGTGVEVLLPDGEVVSGPSAHADDVLSTWLGRRVALVPAETFGAGVCTATVQPAVRCERCTMVTRPQPGLDRDLDVFKVLARHHGSTFGTWTNVLTPGVVRVGDEVTLTD